VNSYRCRTDNTRCSVSRVCTFRGHTDKTYLSIWRPLRTKRTNSEIRNYNCTLTTSLNTHAMFFSLITDSISFACSQLCDGCVSETSICDISDPKLKLELDFLLQNSYSEPYRVIT
jgi:hypothetical protein